VLLTLQGNRPPAILALSDGTVFMGQSIGHDGHTAGEVVFNTSMTGYQEILTDPSYNQQLVTLTYSHIGNYGVNTEDNESSAVHAAGLIIKNLPIVHSNFRASDNLSDFLKSNRTVAIADIDTRMLTRHLRENGAQNGAIHAFPMGHQITDNDIKQAVAQAKAAPSMSGLDLASKVSVEQAYAWTQTEWKLGSGYGEVNQTKFKVVAFDFGIKKNILRMLAQRGCEVTVVPANIRAEDVMKFNPNGVFLSNGPGDPGPCSYAIEATQNLLNRKVPMFGICLGHQILALACGAKTYKMKFGHHGANHPVKDLLSSRVSITSQNHGFAVDESTLPPHLRATHVSLFDGSLQGIEVVGQHAFGFQGHPEASPGPHDIGYLFDRFLKSMAV
jgi:carbamoyl-phosphate synthase small subunit